LRSNRIPQRHQREVTPQVITKSIPREVAPHITPRAIIREAAPQPLPIKKAESEEDYTPYRVRKTSSHLNEENLKLLDHVHGCRTWEEYSNKEAVKMHTWLQTSALATPSVVKAPVAPVKKGREYELCPTKATKSIPAPARRSKPPQSESSFSSSAVTSRQDEEEREQASKSCCQPTQHHHHHHQTTIPSVKSSQVREHRENKHQVESTRASTVSRRIVVPIESHHHRTNKKPIAKVQDPTTSDNMTNMVTALMQMAQAITDGKATSNHAHQSNKIPSDKFKIFFHLTLKKVSLSKGESPHM